MFGEQEVLITHQTCAPRLRTTQVKSVMSRSHASMLKLWVDRTVQLAHCSAVFAALWPGRSDAPIVQQEILQMQGMLPNQTLYSVLGISTTTADVEYVWEVLYKFCILTATRRAADA